MESQNIFSPIATAVSFFLSVAAFVLSSVSFYLQYFKESKLTISFGDEIRLYYNSKNQLIFTLTLTIANNGAKDGILSKCSGTISGRDSEEAQFRWYTFWESKNVAKEADDLVKRFVFAGYIEPIVIPKYGVVVKKIAFRTLDRFELGVGKYSFQFIGQTGFDFSGRVSTSIAVPISEEWKTILDKSVANERGITQESLLLLL
jgi:hypothetical protein